MRAWVKLPAAPSSKFGIFAQPTPTLLSIDHVLVGKWQGGSKPLRLQPSRWAELAKRGKTSLDIRGGFLRSRKKGSCMLGWQAVGWLIQDNDARWTAAGGEVGCLGALRASRSLA